ncbi:hypothetical protein [Methyloceanibacter sp.]|uniref:hypothetical protein n=1 Tax=Methyloceanibacter sp. TaxID=1965321 RepID=UPI003D6CA79B
MPMMSWGRAEDKAGRFLKELDAQELNDQLGAVRDYLRDLTGSFSKIANRRLGYARGHATDTVHEAEELMKGNLAASLVVALGVGVLVGYLIRRGTE